MAAVCLRGSLLAGIAWTCEIQYTCNERREDVSALRRKRAVPIDNGHISRENRAPALRWKRAPGDERWHTRLRTCKNKLNVLETVLLD